MNFRLIEVRRQPRGTVRKFAEGGIRPVATEHDVVDEAVQVHGGAGVVNDHGVERLHRDATITRICEGTADTRKNDVARELPDEGV